jgi:hypothetical protein
MLYAAANCCCSWPAGYHLVGSGNCMCRSSAKHVNRPDRRVPCAALCSQGITIVEGDCIADVAVNSTVKLLHLLGHHNIPVALSTLKAANPFPERYRSDCILVVSQQL